MASECGQAAADALARNGLGHVQLSSDVRVRAVVENSCADSFALIGCESLKGSNQPRIVGDLVDLRQLRIIECQPRQADPLAGTVLDACAAN